MSAAQIRCPTLITEAEGDFAGGGSRRLYDLLACPQQYRSSPRPMVRAGTSRALAQ